MKTLLLLALPLLAAAQGSIQGTAVDRLTKAPVARVRIKMTAYNEPGRYYYANTDAAGVYRFDDLPAGSYSPWIDPPEGYYPPDPMKMLLDRTRVEVKDGATATFDVEVTPPSIVRGRVFDPDGEPVPHASIFAYPIGPGLRMGMGRSDAEGRYSLRVPPGKYRLQVRSNSDRWVTTHYPNVADESLAAPVDVPEAVDLGGYDIRVRPAEGHKLRGIVRDSEGKLVPGAKLTISERTVKSGADGAFEFSLVPPGEWKITGKVDRQLIGWEGSARVTMAHRDLDGVEVRLYPPFDLDASLEGAPKDHRPIQFRLLPAEAGPFPPAATEKEGRARFYTLYPGLYRPAVFGIPGHYLKAVLQGDVDVTGRELELGPGSPALKFVFAPNGGRVTGEVEKGASAKVALIWADPDNYVPGTDLFTIDCDAQGRFAINDLRPGNWYAIAFTGKPTGLRDKVFKTGLWRDATAVRVSEGETASVKLSVTNF